MTTGNRNYDPGVQGGALEYEADIKANATETVSEEASLESALKSIASSAARAESDADVEALLAEVRQLGARFTGREHVSATSAESIHAKVKQIIALTEARPVQLRAIFAEKRRIQE